MADVVKRGIMKANEDLEKENQEKLTQEVSLFFKTLALKATLSSINFV